MSSRALRKAQREREEQAQSHQIENEDDSEEEQHVPVVKQSAFALLGEAEDEEEDNDDEDEEQDLDEGVKLPTEERSTLPAPAPPSSKKSKKKSKKKKRAANKVATPVPPEEDDEELDEIDKALKQLATNGDATQTGTTTAGIDHAFDSSNKLLAVDTSHLHAANEMRRLFGRTALEQEEDEAGPAPAGGNRRQQRRVQQMGLAQALRGQRDQGGRSGALAAMALRRNIFIQGKEEWPVATGGGLGMEIEEKRPDGTVLYRFVHNTTYQRVQSQFNSCVESMDPNRLVLLLQHNPYHISTLLQVSEIAKQERDAATSGDLLERALFSFGRAVHSSFAKALSEGKARLDFARPENREFWLAGWRYIQSLSMRATWRTVYEWTKLLLALSPTEDPYGLWLVLDQYALRSKQDLDYLNLSRDGNSIDAHKSMPSIQFSQALAEHRAGNSGKGKQALFTAIGHYPWVIARLMQELALDPPPAVWGKEPRTDREKLYTELYATRAKDLWGTPEASALLTEVAAALPPDTPSASPDTSEISREEARHVLLADTPALISLLPRSYTTALSSSSDPLPPTESITSYASQMSRAPQPSSAGRFGLMQAFISRMAAAFSSGEDDTDAIAEEYGRQIAGEGASEEDVEMIVEQIRGLGEGLRGAHQNEVDEAGNDNEEEHDEEEVEADHR